MESNVTVAHYPSSSDSDNCEVLNTHLILTDLKLRNQILDCITVLQA